MITTACCYRNSWKVPHPRVLGAFWIGYKVFKSKACDIFLSSAARWSSGWSRSWETHLGHKCVMCGHFHHKVATVIERRAKESICQGGVLFTSLVMSWWNEVMYSTSCVLDKWQSIQLCLQHVIVLHPVVGLLLLQSHYLSTSDFHLQD